MTVADDLATLRLMYAHWTSKDGEDVFCPDARDVDAALDRVEAEILRLERENNRIEARLLAIYEEGGLGDLFARLGAGYEEFGARADAAEAEAERLRGIIRAHWSPSQADALLAEGDGREPDGYGTEGGRSSRQTGERT